MNTKQIRSNNFESVISETNIQVKFTMCTCHYSLTSQKKKKTIFANKHTGWFLWKRSSGRHWSARLIVFRFCGLRRLRRRFSEGRSIHQPLPRRGRPSAQVQIKFRFVDTHRRPYVFQPSPRVWVCVFTFQNFGVLCASTMPPARIPVRHPAFGDGRSICPFWCIQMYVSECD